MLFELLNNQPIPVPQNRADGSRREVDGETIFTLHQAVERFGLPAEVLEGMHQVIYDNAFPVDAPVTAEVLEVPNAGAERRLIARLAQLKAVMYPKLSQEHFDFFIEVCRQRRLNPWARQLVCSVEHDETSGLPRPVIITCIAGLQLIAHRTNIYAGAEAVRHECDEAKMPFSATATVFKLVGKQQWPYSATVYWKDYYPGEGTFWDEMPFACLAKCAEAAALRRAFPEELGGFYAPEEMQQARRRKRKTKQMAQAWTPDDDGPTSPRSLELALIDLGYKDPTKRRELIARLRKDFIELGDTPAFYATAFKAVQNNPTAYEMSPA